MSRINLARSSPASVPLMSYTERTINQPPRPACVPQTMLSPTVAIKLVQPRLALIWLRQTAACLCILFFARQVVALDLSIASVQIIESGKLLITYPSDVNGRFTLLQGPTLDNVTKPILSAEGQNGPASFLLETQIEDTQHFYRIQREQTLLPEAFISSPTDGSALSSEGFPNDPGAVEWNERRVEEGDSTPGAPFLTPEQQSWLRQPLVTRIAKPSRSVSYDNVPRLPNDETTLLLRALRTLDLAYRHSFDTNGMQSFDEAIGVFNASLATHLLSPGVIDPFPLVLQTSRSMTPIRRVRFLSLVGRDYPAMRDLMQATLWRLALLERQDNGWSYSQDGKSEDQPGTKARILSLGVYEPRIDYTAEERARLSYGPEGREIAVALLATTDDEQLKISLINFLIDLAGVAVPNGVISKHILGGVVAGVTFEPLVRPELWLDGTSDFVRSMIQLLNSRISQARQNAIFDERLERLEERVALLEKRVSDLESNMDARLVRLEQAVASLEGRVMALESWQKTVEERLSEIELRLDLIETLGVPSRGLALPKREDRDADGIDDRVERLLIDAYSPVFMIQDDWRPPVSAEWFVQHSYLRGPGEDPDSLVQPFRSEWARRRSVWKNDPYKFIEEYERLVSLAKTRYPNVGGIEKAFRLQLDREEFRDGKSDIGDRMTWERAKREGNVGMYAHVVRGDQPGEYIIQYFMLLTWNETAYSFGIGNHEGDWIAATLFIHLPEYTPRSDEPVDVLLSPDAFRQVQLTLESDSRIDRIIMARVCNHGRYIDARGDKVDIRNIGSELGPLRGGRKPQFWMEGGAHELWPHPGGRGYSGWPGVGGSGPNGPASIWQPLTPLDSPRLEASENKPLYRDGKVHRGVDFPIFGFEPKFRPAWILADQGYRVSFDFGPGTEGFGLNEHKVVRSHLGSKGAYITRSIPNLGEITREFSKSAELVLRYSGLWGGWWKGSESPEGPWKDEMWISPHGNGERKAAGVDPLMRRHVKP